MSAKRLNNGIRFPGSSCLWMLLLASVAGCGPRHLTITRDDHINTIYDRNGVPLSIDIVSVYPDDFKKDQLEHNRLLKPFNGNKITAKDWFERKPTPESMNDPKNHPERFWLSRGQILSYTAEKQNEIWGIYKGAPIRGMAYLRRQGRATVETPEIPGHGIFSGGAVIYVFCKFTNASGQVLPVRPAVFHRVGDYRRQLSVHISADKIGNTTERKIGTDSDGDGYRDH